MGLFWEGRKTDQDRHGKALLLNATAIVTSIEEADDEGRLGFLEGLKIANAAINATEPNYHQLSVKAQSAHGQALLDWISESQLPHQSKLGAAAVAILLITKSEVGSDAAEARRLLSAATGRLMALDADMRT